MSCIFSSRSMYISGYYMEGFLALQKAVDESIIKELNPGAELDTVNVQLQRFPYPAYTTDILYILFKSIVPLVMFICFCPAIVCMAEDVVIEKETMLRVICAIFLHPTVLCFSKL